VDNFLEEVLGVIFGRFFTGHRPWRGRPGGFFGGRGAIGKMGMRFFAVFDPLFARFGAVFTGFWALFRTLFIHVMCMPVC
jgi:hypothetical protein